MPKSTPIPLTASGAVVLEPRMGPFSGASLTVTLEDIGLADAPARPLAALTTEQLSYDARARLRIPFEFRDIISDVANRLSVRAHLSFHGGASIESGDWVTTRTYPVRSAYPQDAIEILLHRV